MFPGKDHRRHTTQDSLTTCLREILVLPRLGRPFITSNTATAVEQLLRQSLTIRKLKAKQSSSAIERRPVQDIDLLVGRIKAVKAQQLVPSTQSDLVTICFMRSGKSFPLRSYMTQLVDLRHPQSPLKRLVKASLLVLRQQRLVMTSRAGMMEQTPTHRVRHM